MSILYTCTKCSVAKPAQRFPKDARKLSGLCSHCFDCRNDDRKAYYARNRQTVLAKKRAKRLADPAAAMAEEKRWRESGKVRRSVANKRRYLADRENRIAAVVAWRKENPAKAKQTIDRCKKAWNKKNPERFRAQSTLDYAKRLARKKGVEYEPVTLADVVSRDGPACYICGITTDSAAPRHSPIRAELEHVVPLSKGGAHIASNLRCACFRCNRVKNYRLTPEQTRAIVLGVAA